MKRKYSSPHRAQSAEHTRQTIIEAAVEVHGTGVTTLSAVAEKAGVSLPTLNKYFPTREDLFVACTGHVAATVPFPSPESLAAIPDVRERVNQLVWQLFQIHEEMFGVNWTGYKLEDESPTLAKTMQGYEEFIGKMVDTLPLDDNDTLKPFVKAILSPLTYRALRLKNGLDFEDAIEHTAQTLNALLNNA